MLYQHEDWLDTLDGSATLLGVSVALLLQVAITLLFLRPLNVVAGLPIVVLVELCVAVGARVTGWWAHRAPVVNGLVTGLVSAALTLAATVIVTRDAVSLACGVSLLGRFAGMGLLANGMHAQT